MMNLMPQKTYEMEIAIKSQPDAVSRILSEKSQIHTGAANAIRKARRVFLVGTGSSLHSALFGRYFFFHYSSQKFIFVQSSYEFSTYTSGIGHDDTVVVISHRGFKRYSYLSLKKAKSAGATTIAITGFGTSIKDGEADFIIHTVEQEKSSAHTVSLTSSMAVMLGLSVLASGRTSTESSEEMATIAKKLKSIVQKAIESGISSAGKFTDSFDPDCTLWISGYGINTISAMEASLKFQETSYIRAYGYEIEQLIHGPLRSADMKHDTFLSIKAGESKTRSVEFSKAIREIEGNVLEISDDTETGECIRYEMAGLPEVLSAFPVLCILQVLALKLSEKLGKNPDSFRSGDSTFMKLDKLLGL